MKTNEKIIIVYCYVFDELLLENYKKALNGKVEVESYVQEKHFSADGDFVAFAISIIHGFSEGFFSGFGEHVANLILDKTCSLVKDHLAFTPLSAKVEIKISDGKSKKIFRVENISQSIVETALQTFKEIVNKDDRQNSTEVSNYSFDENELAWELKETEIKEYFEKMRHNANQNTLD